MSKAVAWPIFVAYGVIATWCVIPPIIKQLLNTLKSCPKKNNGGGGGGGGESGSIMEDRIGQLPEDVISVVLSYLTLKEAGRTSVLSRRWRNMWKLRLSPRLKFDASNILYQIRRSWPRTSTKEEEYILEIRNKQKEYIKWVDNQEMDDQDGPDLDEFIMVFHLDETHSLFLNKWISLAVKRRVKAIKIDLLPPLLSTDETRYGFYPLVSFDDAIRRYSLKRSTLFLPGIECLSSIVFRFININRETIEHLLVACPLLERLSLVYVTDLGKLSVVGPSLRLKYLVIFSWDISCLEISAPNLVLLHLYLAPGTLLRLDGLRRLTDVSINADHLDKGFLIHFKTYSSQLKTLSIPIAQLLDYQGVDMSLLGPPFANLKHLTIQLGFMHRNRLNILTEIINACPLLHKFTLKCSRTAILGETVFSGDSNSHRYLKVVEITRFISRPPIIQIIDYFLKNYSLKKLIIDTCNDFYDARQMWQTVEPGSMEEAEKLRNKVPPGVEFQIL